MVGSLTGPLGRCGSGSQCNLGGASREGPWRVTSRPFRRLGNAGRLPRLRRGAELLRRRDHAQIAELAAACRRSVTAHVDAWVAASIAAKGWNRFPAATAEEWASGPVPVARYLHQLEHLHRSLQHGRPPELPALGGDRYRVPPSPGRADGLLLRGLRITLHGTPGARVQPPSRRCARPICSRW